MHRALLINELVESIIRHLVALTPEGTYTDTATLSSLARTCRALSEPALDAMWAKPDLWNLAQTIDSDLRTVTTVEKHQKQGEWVRIEETHTLVSSTILSKESQDY
jgi:hypothetical protein